MPKTQTQDTARLQVNVDFSQYPDLFDALLTLEVELDTDKSKLIRSLIREKAQEHGHLKDIKTRVVNPKIAQVRKVANTVTYHKHNISQEGK
jgi:hypothetical protein